MLTARVGSDSSFCEGHRKTCRPAPALPPSEVAANHIDAVTGENIPEGLAVKLSCGLSTRLQEDTLIARFVVPGFIELAFQIFNEPLLLLGARRCSSELEAVRIKRQPTSHAYLHRLRDNRLHQAFGGPSQTRRPHLLEDNGDAIECIVDLLLRCARLAFTEKPGGNHGPAPVVQAARPLVPGNGVPAGFGHPSSDPIFPVNRVDNGISGSVGSLGEVRQCTAESVQVANRSAGALLPLP
ncbi:hypothetical protein SAMN05421854_101880 [Amycolatopsis rubida]|uniref:Uncharacterized protein n=1 Tax=Amycolatopsis rubida TaxID=112413 RepID=A0A1I5EZY6_9PSEU|nr:hypothetical protein SAMN05421854_101880 [Amycolatopsis rubida]